LPGGNRLRIAEGSRLAALYGRDEVEEEFWCNFALNPDYQPALEDAGLRPSALAGNGCWRAVEIPGHPFFVATLFLPQHRSSPSSPHPVFIGFVRAAALGANILLESNALQIS
jgi:CTP synthase (UTP-ammonia lyase)